MPNNEMALNVGVRCAHPDLRLAVCAATNREQVRASVEHAMAARAHESYKYRMALSIA